MPYSEIVLEHFRHPRNYGALDTPDFAHEDVNPLCGDRIRIEVAVAPDGTVREARFVGDLCMISKAAASLLTEMIAGMPLESVRGLPQERLVAALKTEMQPARLHCAVLPLEALKAAIAGDVR